MAEFAATFFSFHPEDETWHSRVWHELRSLESIQLAPVPVADRLADTQFLLDREVLFERASHGVILLSPSWMASPFVRDIEWPSLVEHQKRGGLRLHILAIGSPSLSDAMDRWLAPHPTIHIDGLSESELLKHLAELRSKLAESPEDLDLSEALEVSSSEAFEQLYREHYPLVLHFFRRKKLNDALSQELTQDTFVKVLRWFKQLQEPSKKIRWLRVIARNVWRNWVRDHLHTDKRNPGEISLDRLQEEVDFEPKQSLSASRTESSEAQLLRREQQRLLHDAIDRLPPLEADLMRLYLQGNSMSDIAARHGLTSGATRLRIHRIRQKLFQKLRGDDSP